MELTMTDSVSLCNLALTHIGEMGGIASIDPPEGSVHAELCAIYFPIVLTEVLEDHQWSFARSRATLARLADDASDGRGRYALPTDYVTAIDLFDSSETRTGFSLEVGVLLTNTDSPELFYVSNAVDFGRWPKKVLTGMSHLLASYLAGSLTRDPKVISAQRNLYMARLAEAKAMDSNSEKQTESITHDFVPAWMRGR
jgi:hypothetical protein